MSKIYNKKLGMVVLESENMQTWEDIKDAAEFSGNDGARYIYLM